MYIWSHLCLVVSLSPFIFSLLLPLFSLISSALSAPPTSPNCSSLDYFSSAFSLIFSHRHPFHCHPSNSLLLFSPSVLFSGSVSNSLSSPGLNDLEMLPSFIWISSGLDVHSENASTESCGQKQHWWQCCHHHLLWHVKNSQRATDRHRWSCWPKMSQQQKTCPCFKLTVSKSQRETSNKPNSCKHRLLIPAEKVYIRQRQLEWEHCLRVL